jgi:hypothetical protein
MLPFLGEQSLHDGSRILGALETIPMIAHTCMSIKGYQEEAQNHTNTAI